MNKLSAQGRAEQADKARREALLEKERLLTKKIELQEGLPFLYGWKWYSWAREFFESTNKLNLLCAANQISKSSTQIRKAIHWATAQALWPSLWRNRPVQFWYLYPSGAQASIEFETKWQQFLPQGQYKDHPVYGWKAEYRQKELFAIRFNSGVRIYFKTYAQNVHHLQTGTCDAIFCDEELPVHLYDELMMRLSASDGYFHMVFTATIGQDFWRQVMEPTEREEEKLPQAAKWSVSMYECMKYEDGSPSHWTLDKINMVRARCKDHNEVLKRVDGRFVVSRGGLKYPQFDQKKHVKDAHPLPPSWLIYSGVDIGSGGEKGHPAAIVFVAVSPDYRQGRVFKGWRGDGVSTTAGDIVEKYIEMKGSMPVVAQFFDWSSKDFETIALSMGTPFTRAEKSHEKGEEIVNSLFKHDMLYVYDTDELQKLGSELSSLKKDANKKHAKDDFCDALRYAVTQIPWDWSVISERLDLQKKAAKLAQQKSPEQKARDRELSLRRGIDPNPGPAAHWPSVEEEFEEWNEAY